ncbi:hypothetical protein IKE71_02775 [Candidatus Saccharibacteria bacterium]|nr:hypothetical protein [Candidatus Saccharibacteria bacterium]
MARWSEATETKWRKWGLDVREKGKDYERSELDWKIDAARMKERIKYKEAHGIYPEPYRDYETYAIENGEMEPRHSKFYVGSHERQNR